jgi:elongation factor G
MSRLLIAVAIEPRSRADQQKLVAALAALAAEDPAIRVSTDSESSQTVIAAASESLLDAKLDLLWRTYGIGVNVSAPQVAYRERLTRSVELQHESKVRTGEPGDRVAVRLAVGPNEPGRGNRFESRIAVGRLNDDCIRAMEEGVRLALGTGVNAGFPVDDVKVVLLDAAFHGATPPAWAFDVVSRAAMREAMAKADPVLVAPVMRLTVTVPEELVAAVIRDLVDRSARIQARERRGDAVVIGVEVWLSTMLGYARVLQAISDGRAAFAMDFDRYEPVPGPGHDPPFGPAMAMRA